MRLIPALLLAATLSACATTAPQQAPPAPERPSGSTQVPPTQPTPGPSAGFRAPQVLEGPGLAGIIRENARTVSQRFGAPRLDVVEGDMRKLQFTSSACVLDVFFYPLSPGAEPVATWIETRRASDGAAVDRAACIQALSR